ncbi:MAG: carboxypeptidase-like regulatory domain-containing protein, partial [Acidobacteria bacterium]|nr:carboxypeptidase-like regulatory domain-containing protein [Acidobacteriota bacterium]
MKRLWAMLFLLCGLAQGQTSRGAVTGTLTDASKAVIAGSSVVLTHSETGVRRSASSNEAGLYRFDAVDPGVYQLKVTHPGFKPSITNMVQVNANRVTTIDLRLEVGTAETVIQVSAESEDLLAKDGPLRGGNFLPREVKELPLIGLNPISLARTLPGV